MPARTRLWMTFSKQHFPPELPGPRCQTLIRWYDNVPIFGWLLLGGRCRQCRGRISLRYPLIEFLNGLMLVLLYMAEVPPRYGADLSQVGLFFPLGPQTVPGLGGLSPVAFVHLRYFCHVVLVECLLVASLIDWKLWIIPEATTTPATWFGLLAGLLIGRVHLVPLWFQDKDLLNDFRIVLPTWIHPWLNAPNYPAWFLRSPHWHGFLVSLVGMAVGGAIVWVVAKIGRQILGREAMGMGDAYLMMMIGAFLGWQAVIVIFFLAPAISLLVVLLRLAFVRPREIPYGPYLSLATLLLLLGWPAIWPMVENYFKLGPLLLPLGLLLVVGFAGILWPCHWLMRAMGWSVDEQLVAEWTAADQNHYAAGERVARQTCQWPDQTTTPPWTGLAASRGTLQEERWRGGNGPSNPFVR